MRATIEAYAPFLAYKPSLRRRPRAFPLDRLNIMSQVVFDLFEQEDGLDALFGLVKTNLPEELYETAYALCCDVAAADGIIREPELRLLEEMRYQMKMDRLHAAAIERGARARHLTL